MATKRCAAPPPPSSGVDRLPQPVVRMEGVFQPAAVSALPEDVLADILRRLPPRGLAVSRCACKAWRDAVDGRRLLRADLLPCSVRGIILGYHRIDDPAFLSCPSTAVPGDIDIFVGARPYPAPYGPAGYVDLLDHCNGLVLFKDPYGLVVSNPATKGWTHLPPPPPGFGASRLVFEPADSPHYEVVLVSESIKKEEVSILCVFSSLTGKWEKKLFAREGEPPVTSSDSEYIHLGTYGAYCRGVLYVRCDASTPFVLRISLSNRKYRVIKVPTEIDLIQYDYVLGILENMVCLASIQARYMLWIWSLDESCGLTQWVLKHHIDLGSTLSRVSTSDQQFERLWTLQVFKECEWYVEGMLHHVNNDEGDNNIRLTEPKLQWDSDNDNVLDLECEVDSRFKGFISCLGFHPFKPVIFLSIDAEQVVAFHMNTSKVQVLGNARRYDDEQTEAEIVVSFLYTPCFMADSP